MAWFFSENVSSPIHIITGENAKHISKSLRMTVGEELTICDSCAVQHNCVIESISSSEVCVRVLESFPCKNEPHTKVTLYQALTKGDKMDFIIQKSVELGVSEIVPVLTERCISRPDSKAADKKIERWNKIALSAAMQSRRGIIPRVMPVANLKTAADTACGTIVVCYELGGDSLGRLISMDNNKISLFIGSEGGFEESEIEYIQSKGGRAATLGSRILRAETAPLAALSVIMYLTGNFESLYTT